jgi:hypothetical protein
VRIRVSLFGSTGEAAACVSQALDRISAELEALDGEAPNLSLIDTLAIQLSIAHPSGSEGGGRGRGSFYAPTRMFSAQAALTYEPWISSDWAKRMASAAETMQRALAAVHKTRITPGERKMAADIISAAIARAASNPPADLVALKPVYLAYASDGERPAISFGSPPLWTDSSYRVVVVPPSEAMSYAYLRDDLNAAQPEVFKLYRRSEGRLEYWEAWPAEDRVTEHRGVCGERGATRDLAASGPAAQKTILSRLKAEAKAAGFKVIPMSRHAGLLVETDISGFGSEGDLDTRHALEEFLNELTGWLGLGHCDGGSTGSGAMDAFCFVVDYDIARKALEAELATSPFAGFRIRRED